MRFPVPIAVPEAAPVVEVAAAEHGREPGREADHEPLLQVERLEEDFLGGFKRFAERGEDFDVRLAWFHGLFQPVSKGGGKPGCRRKVVEGSVRTLSVCELVRRPSKIDGKRGRGRREHEDGCHPDPAKRGEGPRSCGEGASLATVRSFAVCTGWDDGGAGSRDNNRSKRPIPPPLLHCEDGSSDHPLTRLATNPTLPARCASKPSLKHDGFLPC